MGEERLYRLLLGGMLGGLVGLRWWIQVGGGRTDVVEDCPVHLHGGSAFPAWTLADDDVCGNEGCEYYEGKDCTPCF